MPISKVGSAGIKDANLSADDLAPGSVTNAKLAGSISNDKLANSSVTLNGTSVALGGTAEIGTQWQAVVVADGSTATTSSAGEGYFIDTTSNAHTINLPSSPSRGDTIAIRDYANTFATNSLTIGRGGSNIGGSANDVVVSTNGSAVTLVYIDSTKGWLALENEAKTNPVAPAYIAATGGTTVTSGNYKTHIFTSSSTFVTTCGGNNEGSNSVEYLVVAGGGGGGMDFAGGGGAGGFRLREDCTPNPLNAPAKLSVAASTTYPVTIGAGGAGAVETPASDSAPGSNSAFSTITSAGGGRGGSGGSHCRSGGNGGSGGGARYNEGNAGAGNTPPVSPSQGNPGGGGPNPSSNAGGGGGAATAGSSGATSNGQTGGPGGTGSFVTTTFIGPTAPSYGETGPAGRYFAGGGASGGYAAAGGTAGLGGGGTAPNSTADGSAGITNTGGGGGGATNEGPPRNGGAGGSGIVMIRYRYQ